MNNQKNLQAQKAAAEAQTFAIPEVVPLQKTDAAWNETEEKRKEDRLKRMNEYFFGEEEERPVTQVSREGNLTRKPFEPFPCILGLPSCRFVQLSCKSAAAPVLQASAAFGGAVVETGDGKSEKVSLIAIFLVPYCICPSSNSSFLIIANYSLS